MMYYHYGFHPEFMGGFGFWPVIALTFLPFIILLFVWSIFWKGLALWHAARRGQPWWFLILLVVNSAGILEIIYLFLVLKVRFSELFSMHEHKHHE